MYIQPNVKNTQNLPKEKHYKFHTLILISIKVYFFRKANVIMMFSFIKVVDVNLQSRFYNVNISISSIEINNINTKLYIKFENCTLIGGTKFLRKFVIFIDHFIIFLEANCDI